MPTERKIVRRREVPDDHDGPEQVKVCIVPSSEAPPNAHNFSSVDDERSDDAAHHPSSPPLPPASASSGENPSPSPYTAERGVCTEGGCYNYVRKGSKGTVCNKHGGAKKRGQNIISSDAVEYLKAWMEHPYPNEDEKVKIMKDTGIDTKQLTNWLNNNRKRYWRPKVYEDIKKANDCKSSGGACTKNNGSNDQASKGEESNLPSSIVPQKQLIMQQRRQRERSGEPSGANKPKLESSQPLGSHGASVENACSQEGVEGCTVGHGQKEEQSQQQPHSQDGYRHALARHLQQSSSVGSKVPEFLRQLVSILTNPSHADLISWEVPANDEPDHMGGGMRGIGKIVVHNPKKLEETLGDTPRQPDSRAASLTATQCAPKNDIFPYKLYNMLEKMEGSEYSSVVSWVKEGRSFAIHDKDSFMKHVAPKFFKQTKYRSFVSASSHCVVLCPVRFPKLTSTKYMDFSVTLSYRLVKRIVFIWGQY